MNKKPMTPSEMGKKGHLGKLKKYGPQYYVKLAEMGRRARMAKREAREKLELDSYPE